MNNKYIIKVGHPLVRPGLTIETEASEGYITEVYGKLMEIVRDINRDEGSPSKACANNNQTSVKVEGTSKTLPYITTIDGIIYSIDKDGNMINIPREMLRGDPDAG